MTDSICVLTCVIIAERQAPLKSSVLLRPLGFNTPAYRTNTPTCIVLLDFGMNFAFSLASSARVLVIYNIEHYHK